MNLKIDMNMEEVAADFEKTNNEKHIEVRQNYLCCCLNTNPDATLRRFHYCFDNFNVHFDYENESYDLIQDTTHIIEMRAVCSNIMLKDVRVLSLAWYELGKTFYDVSRMVARECLLVADFLRTTFPDYERGQEKIEDLRRELNDENNNGE